MYRWITLAGVLLVTGSAVALLLVGNEPELEEVVVEISTSAVPGLGAVIAETSTAQAGLGAVTPEISTASAGLGAVTPEIKTGSAGLAAVVVEISRPAGACCHPLTGGCTEVDEGTCMGSGSDFQGNGTTCSPNPCPAPPMGTQCQLAKLTAGDAACSDFFGAKVSISGDRVLIAGVGHDHFGNNAGVAYIFRRDGTTWIEEAELSASDAMADDEFGIRVSISGDRALIGAWAHDHFGTNAGAAYIFKRNGSTWIQEAELKGNDTTGGDAFGLGVCLSEDFAVIGAPGDNCAAGGDCGSAYVFRREGTSWVQEAKLVASNAAAADKLGVDCSISGNRVVVGATQGNPSAFIPFPGKAYVFRRDGMTWEEEAELAGTDAGANDLFGLGVSIDGDYIFVGASFHDAVCPQDPDCNSGAVYVFQRTGNTWVETQKLTALDTGQADNFGKDVALRGDLAVVGADGDDDFGFNTGAAYIFRREGNLWIENAKLTANDPKESDRLGFSVSLSGGLVVAGAFQDDDAFPTDSGCNSGSAYVFAIGGDCNNNSSPDACDILDGISQDANGNGVPDECEQAGCGTLLVQVNEHTVGGGNGSTIVGIEGLQLCVFDKSAGSCARNIGISRRHYPEIFTTCDPVVCQTTDADGAASIILEAGDYVLIGEYDPDGFPPNDDGDELFIGVSAGDFQCAADGDPNTITMRKHLQVIILPNGRTIRVNPRGGGSGRSTANDWVEITNVAGPDDSISVTAVDEDIFAGVGSYTATGTAIGIDSLLIPGQLFMTILIPFHAEDLSGSEPLSVDLTSYNRSTLSWELAVGGNTQPSPGHGVDVIGDRFAVMDGTMSPLSDELGDYGVFWNPDVQEGFVWANVDYTGEFANARQTEAALIPTVTEWGVVIMTLLLLAGGKIYFGRRRSAPG